MPELDPNSANQMAQIELRSRIEVLEKNQAVLAAEVAKAPAEIKELRAEVANQIAKIAQAIQKLQEPKVSPVEAPKRNKLAEILSIFKRK